MPNAIIHELLNLTPTTIREMQELMSHLSDTPCTEDALQQAVSTPHCHVYVAELEGRIVGTATLCLFTSPLGAKASVEDVVVHPEYRGQHLGRQLMAHLLEASRQYAPSPCNSPPVPPAKPPAPSTPPSASNSKIPTFSH